MSTSLRPPVPPSRAPSRSSSQNSTKTLLPLAPVQSQTAGGAAPLARVRSPVHLPLYRRLLFPHEVDPERRVQLVVGEGVELDLLNERLHHLVALILRAYVLSWYTRFTRDRTLLPYLHHDLLAPVLSPVLTRTYHHPESICGLVLLDAPALLGLHLRTYWEAKEGVGLMAGRAGGTSLAEAYHARLPLLCVAPAEPLSTSNSSFVLSPLYLSALATALLPSPSSVGNSSRPPQPDVQRLMAREVVARAVLAGTCRRLYHGWFWYGLMLRFLGEPGEPTPWRRSAKAGLSGKSTPPVAEGDGNPTAGQTIDQLILHTFLRLISLLFTLYTALISFFTFCTSIPADSSPEYTAKFRGSWVSAMLMLREMLDVDGRGRGGRRTWRERLIWGGVEMIVGLTGGLLDRLIPHIILSRLNPTTSLKVVTLVERLLFPLEGGYPGPSLVDPTPEEAFSLRKRAEHRLGEVIPGPLRTIFCPTQQDVARILEPLSDPGCNAHLVGMVLDCLVATLVPDLVAEGFGDVSSGEMGVGGEDEAEGLVGESVTVTPTSEDG